MRDGKPDPCRLAVNQLKALVDVAKPDIPVVEEVLRLHVAVKLLQMRFVHAHAVVRHRNAHVPRLHRTLDQERAAVAPGPQAVMNGVFHQRLEGKLDDLPVQNLRIDLPEHVDTALIADVENP